MMRGVLPYKLSRQRFFEVKKVLEEYNNDEIGFDEFVQRISIDEAEAYEFMVKHAHFNLVDIDFS